MQHGTGNATNRGACQQFGNPLNSAPVQRARLDGSFKQGKANGPGVYVSAKGVRYEGQFVNGKLEGLKAADCPLTPGPLTC